MNLFDIIILGIGLSMDAFAVSICKGLAMNRTTLGKCAIVGGWFGFFQAIMPFIGYSLVNIFSDVIDKFDYIISFVLLAIIGSNMIREALSHDDDGGTGDSLCFKVMLVLALATSIDALAAGATFVGMDIMRVLMAVCIIGVITFVMSAVGVKVGSIFGAKYKSKAEFVGGAILILLGLKFLIEGLIQQFS